MPPPMLGFSNQLSDDREGNGEWDLESQWGFPRSCPHLPGLNPALPGWTASGSLGGQGEGWATLPTCGSGTGLGGQQLVHPGWCPVGSLMRQAGALHIPGVHIPYLPHSLPFLLFVFESVSFVVCEMRGWLFLSHVIVFCGLPPLQAQ